MQCKALKFELKETRDAGFACGYSARSLTCIATIMEEGTKNCANQKL